MSLQVWLPFINNINDQGLLSVPAPSYQVLTQQTDGKLGKCYSGAAVYHLNDSPVQNVWSVALWVKKIEAWSTSNDILFAINKKSTSSDAQLYFSIYDSGTKLHIGINGNITSNRKDYAFATNTWYHLTATYDGSTYSLYVNGNLLGTGTFTTALLTGCKNIGIGCRSNASNGTAQSGGALTKFFNDIRLYDHCLSAKEVEEISKGLVAHYKLDDLQLSTTAYDSSGYNNNGITIGTFTTSNNTAKYDYSTVFNGTDNAIYLPAVTKVKDSITVAMWAYMTNWSNYPIGDRMISCAESAGWSISATGDKIRCYMGTGTTANTYIKLDSNTTYTSLAAGWHHFALTYDGYSAAFYLDGQLNISSTPTQSYIPIFYHTNNSIFIGAEAAGSPTVPTPGYYYLGNISDVRIYAKALTADQIKELYDTSVTVDKNGNLYARELVE